MDPKDNLTIEESYNAMLYFLNNFIEFTDSTDITDILNGAEYFSNGEISDPAFSLTGTSVPVRKFKM